MFQTIKAALHEKDAQMFGIRAVDNNGKEFWYTGRAGSDWVSPNIADAFCAYSLDGARRKATQFNQNTALHGLRFVVPCGE